MQTEVIDHMTLGLRTIQRSFNTLRELSPTMYLTTNVFKTLRSHLRHQGVDVELVQVLREVHAKDDQTLFGRLIKYKTMTRCARSPVCSWFICCVNSAKPCFGVDKQPTVGDDLMRWISLSKCVLKNLNLPYRFRSRKMWNYPYRFWLRNAGPPLPPP